MRTVTEVPIEDFRALNQAILAGETVTARARLRPAALIRALRSTLRMSQSQLGRRSGVPKAHICRIEAGRLSPRLETVERLLDAMFCDLLVLPRARVRPREAIARKRAERPVPWRYRYRIWDD
ncbi:MAG: helix-turn-helix domain-containing protein [Elusimicrobia bacterium]|nr:helix-turn-helix domain-containing protein [Elusimicrobiota bacterium]